jgi:hypothetical protein
MPIAAQPNRVQGRRGGRQGGSGVGRQGGGQPTAVRSGVSNGFPQPPSQPQDSANISDISYR